MASGRQMLIVGLLLLAVVCAALTHFAVRAAESLPTRLSDQEFWRLTEDLSEPNGYFQSDNLLSNEIWLQYIIPELMQRTKPGVYLGVGPEQNYTYISAIKPKMVFLPDIRRGNLDLQLMYKAIFELAADRADFVSLLFSKKRPDGLTEKSSALDIFNAYEIVEAGSSEVYAKNLKAIDNELVVKHHLPLSADDLNGIDYVYENFYRYGPHINYSSSSSSGFGRGGNFVTYADLMEAMDAAGVSRSYLATEGRFKVVKDLEEKNLMVPVVGNLGGPKAIRAIGKYVRDHGGTIEAFYLSNVEQYLQRDGLSGTFCRNVAALPLDSQSTFIRSQGGGGRGGFGGNFGGGFNRGFGGRGGLMSYLGAMQAETKGCVTIGR